MRATRSELETLRIEGERIENELLRRQRDSRFDSSQSHDNTQSAFTPTAAQQSKYLFSSSVSVATMIGDFGIISSAPLRSISEQILAKNQKQKF